MRSHARFTESFSIVLGGAPSGVLRLPHCLSSSFATTLSLAHTDDGLVCCTLCSIVHEPRPRAAHGIFVRACVMQVINVEQASIAEEAGAVAVMALERVPADIRRDGKSEHSMCAQYQLPHLPHDHRKDTQTNLLISMCHALLAGGVSRMSDPKMIKEIMAAVTIPVCARVSTSDCL